MHDSRRLAAVIPPVIPIIAELIKANPGTISLGQGVVHWGPPKEALHAAASFGKDPREHLYSPTAGTTPLLDALETKLWQQNKIKVAPASRILATAGSNMAFHHAVLAITDPGDEIILNAPYYFNHHMAVTLADCTPVIVPTNENFQLQPHLLRDAITDKTRAIVTISPNNPTGVVYPADALYEVNQLCRDAGIYHISDEAYEHFIFGNTPHFSPAAIAEAADYTLSLFSLSKSFGMASWRMGYMVIPEHLLANIKKIQDTLLICPPVISQAAAAAALTHAPDYPHKKIPSLLLNRHLVQTALASLSDFIRIAPTEGAFYYFLKILTDIPAQPLAEHLIRQYKVALLPGETFGMTGQDATYLRLAYAALPPEQLQQALTRLTTALPEILTAQ